MEIIITIIFHDRDFLPGSPLPQTHFHGSDHERDKKSCGEEEKETIGCFIFYTHTHKIEV